MNVGLGLGVLCNNDLDMTVSACIMHIQKETLITFLNNTQVMEKI